MYIERHVFYSRKLNPAQKNYKTGEKEMLSIVETLREYRIILLGYPVTIYNDHSNKTRTETLLIQRWR
jgi:hypothetical protein